MLEAIVNLEAEYWQAYITMGESGIGWIDAVFRFCVIVLVESAKLIGVSYEELNVLLFVIALPVIILLSVSLNIILIFKLRCAKINLSNLGVN